MQIDAKTDKTTDMDRSAHRFATFPKFDFNESWWFAPSFFACLFGADSAEKYVVDQEGGGETEENKEEARPELFRERGSVLKTHGIFFRFFIPRG